MRIKCPRCGLVNKPDVAKCQSCGEDLSDLLDLDLEMPVRDKPDLPDPLSIDNIKMNRRKERAVSKDSAKNEQKSLDLDWRDELNRRVNEIKKERAGRTAGLPKDTTERIKDAIQRESLRKKTRSNDEDLDTYRPSRRKVYDDEDEEPIVTEKPKKYRQKQSEVFDDDHTEDYDYETEDYGGSVAAEDEEETGPVRISRNEDEADEEAADESDVMDQPVLSDPDDVKRYIAEKVARRKARSGGGGRTLSEEYGYKPRTRTKAAEPERVSSRKPRKDMDIDSPESPYDSRSIYRPIQEEEPEIPSERLLSEETRSLITSKRIYAGVWDNIILLAISFIIIKFGADALDVTLMQLFSASWEKLIIFYLLLSGFYNTYFIGSNGQTIGKMFMHIRLMTVEGKQISFFRAFFHYIFSVIGMAAATVGFFWLMYNRESRNWADLITGIKTELYRN